MSLIAFIRHGRTLWNEAGRIQGHTDTELSPRGRSEVEHWRLPVRFHTWQCFCSPLRRTRDTAILLGVVDPTPAAELIEMDWGQWEGKTLKELRAELGEPMVLNESLGLDFRPNGGESPRDVRDRLKPWIAGLKIAGALPAIAVCHKGVIRSALSLATGWTMEDKWPVKLRDDCAQLFRIVEGNLEIEQLNIPLNPDS